VSGVLIAGCGGSSGSLTAATVSAGTASVSTAASAARSELGFSKCMRANGVPNFPDLSNNGMRIEASPGQTLSINGVSINAPAFAAARQKCQKYLPHQQATPAQAAQQRQQGLEFSKCMRSHGVPNFPDPKVVSSAGGNRTVYLPGINFQSPAFQAAAKACGGGPKGP
jgi:hypothetical protein